MPMLPAYFASRAGKRVAQGARLGAGYGVAAGGAVGGLHGALTDDPNNPNEGRIGRILSHATSGALMGAGAGGAIGAGRGQIQNLTSAARRQGLTKGLAIGGVAGAGIGSAANSNVAKGVYSRASQKIKDTIGHGAVPTHDPYAPYVGQGRTGGSPAGATPPPVIHQPGPQQLALPPGKAAPAAAPTGPGASAGLEGMNLNKAQTRQWAVNQAASQRAGAAEGTLNRNPNAPTSIAERMNPDSPFYDEGLAANPGKWKKAAGSSFWTGFMGKAYGEF